MISLTFFSLIVVSFSSSSWRAVKVKISPNISTCAKAFIEIYFTGKENPRKTVALTNLSRRKGKLFFRFCLISCWMDTFAHFRRSKELHNEEIAIAYTRIFRSIYERIQQWEKRREIREENAGKLKMLFLAQSRFAHAVEWIFPQALFSVWVLVFVIQVGVVRAESIISLQKGKQQQKQPKCELCLLLSVELFYEIN